MRRSAVSSATFEVMRFTLFPVSLVVVMACEPARDVSQLPKVNAEDPHAFVVPETKITKASSSMEPDAIEQAFQAASATLLHEEFDAAAIAFDELVAADPQGPSAGPSLYNAGMAYAGKGDLTTAAARFRASAELDPAAPTSRLAWVRTSRMNAYLENWDELESVADKLLARGDLSVLERIEALGAKALSLVERGRVDEAYAVIVKARNQIEDRQLGQAGTPPLELAQVAFALGEIRKAKSEKLLFDPMPSDFGAVLEDRCTGLLDAQAAFTDAMRSNDAHWSAMAGFRVGQLYQNLHRDVIKVPAPSRTATVKSRQLWEGAMRLRYRVLLEKGLKMMEGTVSLGERTGESSLWITRAREAKLDLENALALEKEALTKLPYTEEELRKVLEDVKKKPVPKP